jgi:glutamyl-tRNA reductase
MTIVSVSLSHRITPVEVLEKLALPPAGLGSVLSRLHAVPSINEVVILSTCNRVEVYAAANGPAEQVTLTVADLLAAHGRASVDDVLRMARTRVGDAAAEHLFTVACGLDSMAVGEDQIVAQIKAAARASAEAGTTGPALTGLIDAALRASKRARTQTAISAEGISLARAGLDIAAAHLDGLADRHAVVLGREAREGLQHGYCARPVSRGCQWPAVTRREPRRWPRRCAPGICRPATCPPCSPAPTCWSPLRGPPRPS